MNVAFPVWAALLRGRMHRANSITIQAPRQQIFEVTSDLARWPEILPHYRSVEFLERDGHRSIVKMSCVRDGGIPVSWVSEHLVDPGLVEMHFRHLKKWTKGMNVVWRYDESPEGTRVSIEHDLNFRISALAPMAEAVIGGFFIENIANKTLRRFKEFFEQ